MAFALMAVPGATACSPIVQQGQGTNVSSTTTTGGFVLQSRDRDDEAMRAYQQAEDKRRIEAEPAPDAQLDPAFAAQLKEELARIDDAVVQVRARLTQAAPAAELRAHVEATLGELKEARDAAEERRKQLDGTIAAPRGAEETAKELTADAKRLLHVLDAKLTEARAELSY
jgi:hypothetical protein